MPSTESVERASGSVFRLLSAASTNSNNIKATAGLIGEMVICNASPSTRYVKFYDKATAPTVGTDTPKYTFAIPPNSAVPFPNFTGWPFPSAGIGIGITALPADNDVTAVGANEVIVNLRYV